MLLLKTSAAKLTAIVMLLPGLHEFKTSQLKGSIARSTALTDRPHSLPTKNQLRCTASVQIHCKLNLPCCVAFNRELRRIVNVFSRNQTLSVGEGQCLIRVHHETMHTSVHGCVHCAPNMESEDLHGITTAYYELIVYAICYTMKEQNLIVGFFSD